jgi:hypothetical protein
MGEWENGRMGEWENGRIGEWENGRIGEWENWRIGELENGRMGEWENIWRYRHCDLSELPARRACPLLAFFLLLNLSMHCLSHQIKTEHEPGR